MKFWLKLARTRGRDRFATCLFVCLLLLASHLGATPLLYNAITGATQGDQFGAAVAGGGDFNGDGYTDLLVGANATSINGPASGTIYLYLGGPTPNLTPTLVYSGAANDFLGGAVAWVGDINNDGYDDFVVGAAFNSDVANRAGKALLFLGGPVVDTVPDLIFFGEAAGDYFGISVAGIGDFNGDGYDDFAIGAYRFNPPGFTNAGAVYIYYGGSSPDTIPDMIIHGKTDGERFGYSISGGLDFTNDGYADLAVGAYSWDTPTELNRGRVYLFSGGVAADTVADLVFSGTQAYAYFGYSLCLVPDLNADGIADLVVGAYGMDYSTATEAGAVYVFHGGTNPDNIPDFSYQRGSVSNDYLGLSVAGVPDQNGDNLADFVTGAPLRDAAGVDAGEAVLFKKSSPSYAVNVFQSGSSVNEEFGHAVSSLGRFAAQWRLYAVSGWGYDSYRGKVYLYGVQDTVSGCNCGDADGNSSLTISDAVYLINYIFAGGPAPNPLCLGDSDNNGSVTISDAVYLINYIFAGGPAPGPNC